MKLQPIIITIILSAVVLFITIRFSTILASYVIQNQEFEAQRLRNEAVYTCSTIAVAQYTDPKNNSDITEPFKPSYVSCLKDKGYQSIVTP